MVRIQKKKFNFLLKIRNKNEGFKDYADKSEQNSIREKPWGKSKADMKFPSATQNEINEDDAKSLVAMALNIPFTANMPTTPRRCNYFITENYLDLPKHAMPCVAVSAFEIPQNLSAI